MIPEDIAAALAELESADELLDTRRNERREADLAAHVAAANAEAAAATEVEQGTMRAAKYAAMLDILRTHFQD